MNNPRTIKIFLAEGEPTGIKIVELANWVGKGFVIPRNSLKEALKRKDLESPAVYFLIGKDENGEDMAYVGESESFAERILDHQRKKDFWNVAVCFISANDFLHKGNVKYLESVLFEEAKKANRIKLESGKNSNKARLSESEEADILAYAQNLKLIMSAIGYTFLQGAVSNCDNKELYYCTGKGVKAKGIYTDEGFVILNGSTISGKEAEGLSGKPLSVLRFQIFNSPKVKKIDNGDYELLEDELFSSPSYAAGFVLGNSVHGWLAWKNKEGKTLDEAKRQNS
ncbi:MAG: GIY-YIG nuclease family protein [Candidatus Nealsonbacteria bacterium]|nr:GIY-YIG nuclease family protein [Candidatus Nealsonbacteria bacterium]